MGWRGWGVQCRGGAAAGGGREVWAVGQVMRTASCECGRLGARGVAL